MLTRFVPVIALTGLIACASAPTAAEQECRERHGLTPGSSAYADCVDKLHSTESQLRSAR